MERVTVDKIDAVVEENYFEKENNSESSWKFSIVKITVLKPNCEET